MPNLWTANHPRAFWLCQDNPPDAVWEQAIWRAQPVLGLPASAELDVNSLLEWTLGEGQFGPHRYQLSLAKRLYYQFKPLISREVSRILRLGYNRLQSNDGFPLGWPIEPRFAQFQWETLRQVMLLAGRQEMQFRDFWPDGKSFAFALTHDIETAEGQRLVPLMADMEEGLGFRSIYNFVVMHYALDRGLMRDLTRRGFEIGLHGLHHDNKLFSSYPLFMKRAQLVNRALAMFETSGFRSPLTLRNPVWMQMLEMEYDQSFFDTDPYEPMPGGTMCIWPFHIGHFIELPYTLPQDYTLYYLMNERSPRRWLEKIDFLEKYHGMALVIVHPDYSSTGQAGEIYRQFLSAMKERGGFWHALPRDIARWWRRRSAPLEIDPGQATPLLSAGLDADGIHISPPAAVGEAGELRHPESLLRS